MTNLQIDLPTNLRIVSLIPSATEIVAELGYGQYLVGRSHECDYPLAVKSLPVCTEPKFNPVGSSLQIHQRVSELLASALSVYRVKTEVLAALKPTHIITQAQCEVCAVSLSDVEQAVASLVAPADIVAVTSADTTAIQVVSLQPDRLADMWADMGRVAAALASSSEPVTELGDRTAAVIEQLKARIQPIKTAQRLKIACIEWTEPLMSAGNWVPELVELAGGIACVGTAGAHSDWMNWKDLAAADPDIIVVMPCGYDLAQTRQATQELAATQPGWAQLSAVQNAQVYLADGNQYFNRPGPRLVESWEILVEIIQQQAINQARKPIGWERF
jgi:iron complex transport system substrate-binding protein